MTSIYGLTLHNIGVLNLFQETLKLFAFHFISRHWDGIGTWILSLWNTSSRLLGIANLLMIWQSWKPSHLQPYFCPSYPWWRHEMETFSALLALCAGNSPVPVNSPHKGQWRGALVFSLICTRINGWVNNDEAGDLRRHRFHYDVTVMLYSPLNILHTVRLLLFFVVYYRHILLIPTVSLEPISVDSFGSSWN